MASRPDDGIANRKLQIEVRKACSAYKGMRQAFLMVRLAARSDTVRKRAATERDTGTG